jgi:hypothetical protein
MFLMPHGGGGGKGGGGTSYARNNDIRRFFANYEGSIKKHNGRMESFAIPALIINDPSQMKRLADDDIAWAREIGPDAVAFVGDGKRVPNQGEDVQTAIKELQCPLFNGDPNDPGNDGDVQDFQRDYEKFQERLKKLVSKVPEAVRFIDKDGDDTLTHLLACLDQQTALQRYMADNYVAEPAPKQEDELACGSISIALLAEKSPGGPWSDWGFDNRFQNVEKHLDCDKLAKKDDAENPKLLREWKDLIGIPDAVLVQDTKIQTGTVEEQGHMLASKTVQVTVYGKLGLTKNPCGMQKVFCEKGGSRLAYALNAEDFYLARAEAKNNAHDKDGCIKAINAAAAKRKKWEEEYEGMKEQGMWTPGGKYKLRDGKTIDENTAFARLKANAAAIDDRKLGYCK